MIEYFKELDNYLKSEKERNKTICLIEIIKNCKCNIEQIFNILYYIRKEDTKYIMINPSSNVVVKVSGQERLDIALERMIKIYEREYITNEPIDEIFEINGRKLRVNIGNFTDINNLTCSERTGYCMRIKVHANPLYNLCQENENGFHIRITGPKTNELIQ